MSTKDTRYIGIRDIARIAGVSTATVSRVINNPETTSKGVREKVLAVIKEYNYIPNQMARNIFSQTSNSLAIFIYDMANPFFIALIKEINKIAFENKFTLLICDTENNISKEREYLNYCEAIRTSGIIFTEGSNYDLDLPTLSNQTIVFLDRLANEKFSAIQSNNAQGMKLLVDYLYNLNHRRIAFAGAVETFRSSTERKNAYIKAMEARGLEISSQYIYPGGFDYKTGVEALDYFCTLSKPPTAIICANDQIAHGMVMCAHKLNIKIPDDLSIVGFDGVDSTRFWPKITTIKQDIPTIAQTLFDIVANPPEKPLHSTIDVSLVRGDSCKKIELQR